MSNRPTRTLPKVFWFLCDVCGRLLELPTYDALGLVHLNHVRGFRNLPPIVVHCEKCAEVYEC
jgi:hypothetical protein